MTDQRWRPADAPSLDGSMTMTWQLSPMEGATLVEITAANVPDGISAPDHALGMAESLANLAVHLES